MLSEGCLRQHNHVIKQQQQQQHNWQYILLNMLAAAPAAAAGHIYVRRTYNSSSSVQASKNVNVAVSLRLLRLTAQQPEFQPLQCVYMWP